MSLDKESTIQELKNLVADFRDERDWSQFHNPKDLAEAISIEAGELLELFLWKTGDQVWEQMKSDPKFAKEVAEELADVIIFCINFANATDLDITTIVKGKIEKNRQKYSVDKAKGVATKYNKL